MTYDLLNHPLSGSLSASLASTSAISPQILPPVTLVVVKPEGGKQYCSAHKADALAVYDDLLWIMVRWVKNRSGVKTPVPMFEQH